MHLRCQSIVAGLAQSDEIALVKEAVAALQILNRIYNVVNDLARFVPALSTQWVTSQDDGPDCLPSTGLIQSSVNLVCAILVKRFAIVSDVVLLLVCCTILCTEYTTT
jgi:hypothetical protein